MFRSIMVPLDGSRFAEAALGVAARIARVAKAELRLVGVHEPQMALVPVADVPISAGPDDLELRARRQEYLADEASRLGPIGRGPVRSELIDGLAGPALVQWIDEHAPDLVVMSSHGRGALSRFWLGSVADHLLREVTVPILLIRPRDGEAAPATGGEFSFANAIVPLDLSPESERILEPLTSLARLLDTHLTLIHVVEPSLGGYGGVPAYPAPMSPDLVESVRARAQRQLDEVADRLRAEGLRVATRVVVAMGIAETVLYQTTKNPRSFTALTTHGATGWRRLLIGSVADKLIRASERPVLVLRPG